jgi:hypothetical protein
VYYRLLELGATFFNYTYDYMLWDLTFAQLLTMIETRNQRELRAYEEAERRQQLQEANPGYVEPPKGLDRDLPSMSDVMKAFGPMPGA